MGLGIDLTEVSQILDVNIANIIVSDQHSCRIKNECQLSSTTS